jgi:DNA-binding Lrp family transcriptional regulator
VITAIVLIETERARAQAVAEALLQIEGVAEVYLVAGQYDLVAMVRVRQYEQMAEVVPQRIAAVPGIQRTQTLMAFEYYSRRDLERMWGLGLESEQPQRG